LEDTLLYYAVTANFNESAAHQSQADQKSKQLNPFGSDIWPDILRKINQLPALIADKKGKKLINN